MERQQQGTLTAPGTERSARQRGLPAGWAVLFEGFGTTCARAVAALGACTVLILIGTLVSLVGTLLPGH